MFVTYRHFDMVFLVLMLVTIQSGIYEKLEFEIQTSFLCVWSEISMSRDCTSFFKTLSEDAIDS